MKIRNKENKIRNKENWNKNNLYYLQNDGVKIYRKNWPIIENQIHEQIKYIINKKYNTINAKIERMKKTKTIVNQGRQHDDNKQDKKINKFNKH